MSTSASYEFIQPLDPIIWGCLPKVNLRKCSGDLLPDLWDLVEYWTAVVSKSWSGDGSEVPEKGMWQRGIFQELFSIPTTLCRAHWQGRACALQAHHAPFQSTVGQITSPKAFPARRKLCVPSATRPYPLFCFAVIYLVSSAQGWPTGCISSVWFPTELRCQNDTGWVCTQEMFYSPCLLSQKCCP